jgi:hypothetical protein
MNMALIAMTQSRLSVERTPHPNPLPIRWAEGTYCEARGDFTISEHSKLMAILSLSPSDGERVGVRGISDCILTAQAVWQN